MRALAVGICLLACVIPLSQVSSSQARLDAVIA
jgi:hypothetical protein